MFFVFFHAYQASCDGKAPDHVYMIFYFSLLQSTKVLASNRQALAICILNDEKSVMYGSRLVTS